MNNSADFLDLEANSTNLNEAISTSEQWENVFAASIMGVLSVMGLIAYLLIIVIIVRFRQEFLENSYYVFVISLAFSDCLMLVLFAFYSVPCTITQSYILGHNFDRAAGVIDNLQYYTGCVLVALIAFNRYLAVCRFHSYQSIFCDRNVYIFMAGAWVFGIFVSSFQIFSPFGQDYYYDSYGWGFDMTRWGNKYYTMYDQTFSVVTFLFLVACYASLLLKRPGQQVGHQNTRDQKRRAKTERNLALQFGLVIILLITQGLGFTIVPLLTSSKWAFLALTVLFIVNNSCSPFIYLIFNSQIRSSFFKLVPFLKPSSQTAVVMTMISTNSATRSVNTVSNRKVISAA
jgi:hypothetical protein